MDFSYLTVLPRGRQIWDYAVFPEEEFEFRRKKLAGLLESLHLDGFIVYSDALSRRYVSYLTNYCNSVSWSASVCLLTGDEPPRIISSMAPRDINYNLKSLAPNVELNAVGLGMLTNHKVAIKAVEYMKEHGLMERRWGGVNMDSLNAFGQEAIYAGFPDLTDYTAQFDGMLAKKDSAEVFAISQATSLAQKAVTDYLRMAVPGANEREIAARIDKQFRAFGVDHIALLVSAGNGQRLCLHQPQDYIIQEGDTVCAHVDILYLHYNGLYGQTMYRGSLDDGRAGFYRGAKQKFEGILREIEAGKRIEDINSVGQGYVLVCGIGADTSEAPLHGKMECGHTFSLTMCEPSDEYGDVFMADTFVVEESGVHVIGGAGVDRIFHKA